MMRNLIAATTLTLLLALVDSKNVRRQSMNIKASNNNVGHKSSRVKGIKGQQGMTQRKNRGLEGREEVTGLGETEVVETEANTDLADGDTGIIGGVQASAGEFPFYVKFEGNTLCGGSLIDSQTVLTAAHCIPSNGRPPSAVRIASNQYSSGGVVVGTSCAVVHPNFIENDQTLMNDVAIIKLDQPVTDASTATISFNTNEAYPSTEGTPLTVIGVGLTSNNGAVSSTLQKLETSFVSIGNCMQTYSEKVVTPEHHICADVANAGDCNGDSGGPVFIGGLQVGIVSFGYGGCASDKFQDVYVNVAAYSDWIDSYMRGDNCQPATTDSTEPDTQDDGGDTNSDTGGDTDGDTGGDTGGDDVDTTDEDDEPSDLDAFLDCFTTVIEVVQGLLGGGDTAGAGNNNNNNGEDKDDNKGGNNDKDNNKGGKNRNGFLRNFFGGGDTEEGGGIVSNFLDGVQNALTNERVTDALASAMGDGDEGDADGGER